MYIYNEAEFARGSLSFRAPLTSLALWSEFLNSFEVTKDPFKGDISNKYPLYKVYMGLIIKGTIPRGPHHFPYDKPMKCPFPFIWNLPKKCQDQVAVRVVPSLLVTVLVRVSMW